MIERSSPADLQPTLERYLGRQTRDELDAAMAVAEILAALGHGPSVSEPSQQLGSLATTCTAEDAGALVSFVDGQGFKPAEDFYALANSRIDLVLARRRGIPISLGVVYLALARRLRLPGHGINFPSHFLVEVAGELIDPLNARVTTRAECQSWLADRGIAEEGSDAFQPTTADDILVRMLNNVRGILVGTDRSVDALTVIDCQISVMPDVLELYLDKAALWQSLGSNDAAKQSLSDAWARTGDERLRGQLERQIEALGRQSGSIH